MQWSVSQEHAVRAITVLCLPDQIHSARRKEAKQTRHVNIGINIATK